MRSTLACLALCTVVVGSTGCGKTSQLVIGIITNLRVRGDLTDVRMDVFRNGVVAGQQAWSISDQRSLDFVLPGSFNLYSSEGGTPVIDVEVGGYVGATALPKITRKVTMQLQSEQTLFYRMALVQACVQGQPNAGCAEGYACIEGVCRTQAENANHLLPYEASRVTTVECDSGSRFIDTGSCGSGTCLQLPIPKATCDADQYCVEGTCYKYDPANPRSLEFSEVCSPENGDTCREAGLTCERTGLVGGGADPGRCRQRCTADAECTRRLPDAAAESIPAALAVCSPSKGVCTFACDPVNAGASGSLSGTRCQVVTDGTKTIAPDCVVASSAGGTVPVGGTCNAQHASDDCTGGAGCVSRNGMSPICLKNCFMDDSSTCPAGETCHAVQTGTAPNLVVSTKYGVCF